MALPEGGVTPPGETVGARRMRVLPIVDIPKVTAPTVIAGTDRTRVLVIVAPARAPAAVTVGADKTRVLPMVAPVRVTAPGATLGACNVVPDGIVERLSVTAPTDT